MQQSNRLKIFSKFSQSIRPLVCKEKLELLHQRYYIREFKIWEIDVSIATNLYIGIITRSKKNMAEKNEFRWVENELRLFVWSICFHTLSHNMDISDMTQSDWQFFSQLFPNKQQILFEYQANNLLKNHNQYKKWVHEQDQLFEQLVKRDKYRLRWSDLGKALFIESNRRFFRTAKQCRQRWLNHLDPSKLKKYWLESEDLTLIEYVKYNGKKWACISKQLQNKRNQHSIKNRFKSLITKESKQELQPRTESQLIDSLYFKLLKSKDQNQNHVFNIHQEQSHYEHEQNHLLGYEHGYSLEQHYISQEKPSQEFLSDNEQVKENQGNRVSKQILGNISLNRDREDDKFLKPCQSQGQNQIFQFTKISCQEIHKGISDLKERQMCNQIQKRVRADLFLQEDPFELLRYYFYKDNK